MNNQHFLWWAIIVVALITVGVFWTSQLFPANRDAQYSTVFEKQHETAEAYKQQEDPKPKDYAQYQGGSEAAVEKVEGNRYRSY